MSCIKPSVLSEPLIDVCDKQALNSSHCKIFEVDINTCKKEDLDFSSAYELTFFRHDTVHGLIAWFDIYFDKLPNKVHFTTDPYTRSTHWKQVIFYTKEDIYVEKGNLNSYLGEVLKGSIAVRKSNANFRELDVKISYHYNGKHTKKDFYQLYKIR